MPVKLVSSGGGSVTLNAPSTGTDFTANVPARDGTLVGADSSGNLRINSGYGSEAVAYGCRAWVNFDGTGVVSIRASGNVSSITDLGTGDYIVNLATPMPDTNYAAVGTWSTRDNNWNSSYVSAMVIGGSRSGGAYTPYYSTTQIAVHNYATGSGDDIEQINIAVFR